ncbi:MAG: N-acetylmuramoyl-L-alanine amidase [Thermodesulfovibrionales bacterium]
MEVTDIRYWSYPEYTRIVITLSDETEFTQKRLTGPDRLYFDLTNARLTKSIQQTIAVGNGMLKNVRAGQFSEDKVRVVLDFDKVRDFRVLTIEDPNRIIVDVYGEKKAVLAKRRIVLDPGHGGHDPGAVGPRKLYEKDVVLDIALKMRKILSREQNVEVFLTRETDVFLSLEERTAIANSKNADLFVSIHANASTQRNARGIETYLLNWTNDEEAMKVAARENAISMKKMRKMQKETSDILEIIKSDLHRESKRDESLRLASAIQKKMVADLNQSYSHIVDHGVKQALFYVLFGAQMPSVLVEVSFISNPLEEKLLSRDGYRKELAQSISSGITHYMKAAPDGQTVAGVR